MSASQIRQLSGFIPIVMSLGALITVGYHVAIFGIAQEADEGAAAHIWQILMIGQVPIMVFYAAKWFPQAPRKTLVVLAAQVGAALVALAPVFWLGW